MLRYYVNSLSNEVMHIYFITDGSGTVSSKPTTHGKSNKLSTFNVYNCDCLQVALRTLVWVSVLNYPI